MITYLASLSGYSWACIVGAWMLLGLVAAITLGRLVKRADDADDAVRAAYPPPVPAPLPRPESDADWASVWPSGSQLIDVDAVHGLLSEDEVYPTADEAEDAVYKALFENLIEMSWPLERQDGGAA